MEKQTFKIPDGCKAITMEQIGNQLVTTFEVEFKRGDVLIYPDRNMLCIFKRYVYFDKFETYATNTKFMGINWQSEYFRLATPEEAQRLWDALAKQGKRWNPETMQVEEIKKDRWRAKRGKDYYHFYWDMNIVTSIEDGRHLDNIRYNSGNYFRTKEQAERAKPYIQKAYNDFWRGELK